MHKQKSAVNCVYNGKVTERKVFLMQIKSAVNTYTLLNNSMPTTIRSLYQYIKVDTRLVLLHCYYCTSNKFSHLSNDFNNLAYCSCTHSSLHYKAWSRCDYTTKVQIHNFTSSICNMHVLCFRPFASQSHLNHAIYCGELWAWTSSMWTFHLSELVSFVVMMWYRYLLAAVILTGILVITLKVPPCIAYSYHRGIGYSWVCVLHT